MIVKNKEKEEKFTPFTIEITFENEIEAKQFRAIFNYNPIINNTSFPTDAIRDCLEKYDCSETFIALCRSMSEGV